MPIIIPPRGSKGPKKPTEKKVPILPGRTGAPTTIRREEVDSAAFNKSVLPLFSKKDKVVPNLPERRIILPQYVSEPNGLSVTLAEVFAKFPPPLRPDGLPIVPYEWQHEDGTFLIGFNRIGVFLPVGAGKTMILTYVCLAWDLDHYVVILPPILIPQWVRWINAIPGAGSAVAYKGGPKLRAQIDLPKFRWWVMSYGIFKNDYNQLLKLVHNSRYALVVDEAHSIKNSESQLHKLAARFSAGQNLAMATGTELNDPADSYAYVKIKTPGVYRSYGQFKDIHVASEDFFGNPEGWRNLDLMHSNLYLQSAHRTKEEVQKHLPRAKYMPLHYELSDEHKKLYKELAEQQILELEEGGKVDATTQQNLWNHMQQIVLNPDGYGRSDLRPAAFDVIDNLLDELDFEHMPTKRKFIVWTWYVQSTELVRDYLESKFPGRVAVAYGKSNSTKEFENFRDNPECWCMVAQPLSAGAGVEPQYVCYNCLFLETPTRTIPFRQAAGRLDRDGQSESANIWIGIADGTIQETLYANLLTNDELVQKVQKNPNDIRKMIYGSAA